MRGYLIFVNDLRFPPPKFALGQPVKSVWISDDCLDPSRYGKQFVDYGVVIGYQPIIEGTQLGQWGYHIYWLYSTTFPQNLPIIDDGAIAESDLEVWHE